MSKKEKEAQKRVPLNITVSREIYDWITKNRGNASRIAEQAYLAVKNDMEFGYGTDAILIKLQNTGKRDEFSQNKQNLTEKQAWTRRKLNPRPLQCQCSSNSGQNSNPSSNIGISENGIFSALAFSLNGYEPLAC